MMQANQSGRRRTGETWWGDDNDPEAYRGHIVTKLRVYGRRNGKPVHDDKLFVVDSAALTSSIDFDNIRKLGGRMGVSSASASVRAVEGLTAVGARLNEHGEYEFTEACSSFFERGLSNRDFNILGQDQLSRLGVQVLPPILPPPTVRRAKNTGRNVLVRGEPQEPPALTNGRGGVRNRRPKGPPPVFPPIPPTKEPESTGRGPSVRFRKEFDPDNPEGEFGG